jgi:sulfite exporter TauE/SafE
MIAYGAGKALTYGFLGTLAGWLGAGVLSAGGTTQAILGIGVAVVLIAAAVARIVPGGPRPAGGAGLTSFLRPVLSAAAASNAWGGRFTLGAATAALPCGVVYLAALQAAAAGSPTSALVLMAGFAVASPAAA